VAKFESAAEDLLMEGNRAWDNGLREHALECYQMLVDRFPNLPDGYNKLGVVSAELGNLQEAERYFLTAIDCDRKHVPSLSNLGNICLERGDLDEAIAYYALALESDPEYPPAHHNLAVAYRKKGELGVFVRHLKKSQRFERQRDRLSLQAGNATRWQKTAARVPDRWWIWVMVLILVLFAVGRALR
jgi:tetratricopeptide (TPR) repeat protein